MRQHHAIDFHFCGPLAVVKSLVDVCDAHLRATWQDVPTAHISQAKVEDTGLRCSWRLTQDDSVWWTPNSVAENVREWMVRHYPDVGGAMIHSRFPVPRDAQARAFVWSAGYASADDRACVHLPPSVLDSLASECFNDAEPFSVETLWSAMMGLDPFRKTLAAHLRSLQHACLEAAVQPAAFPARGMRL